MITFFDWIAGIGGVGAVFAVILFFVYRWTVRQQRDDRKYMEDRLSKVIDDYNRTSSDNTKVLWELITWLKAKNGSK